MPFLLIDKPPGVTSHDVVNTVRRITGEKRVGHAGTLDPFATGLLIIGVGRESTKHLGTFLGMDKAYDADIVLGASTETLDTEGEVVPAPAGSVTTVTANEVLEAAKRLTGNISQVPPMHSAIKIGGKKMYNLARAGQTVEIPPREVTIHDFAINNLPETLTLPATIQARISCSSGTYIRSLARDLGIALGTTAYLSALRRTQIGKWNVADAATPSQLTPENWFDFAKNDMLL